jgi:hypothetical protein
MKIVPNLELFCLGREEVKKRKEKEFKKWGTQLEHLTSSLASKCLTS